MRKCGKSLWALGRWKMRIGCIEISRQSCISVRLGCCILMQGTKVCKGLNQPVLFNWKGGRQRTQVFWVYFFKVKIGRLSDGLSRGVRVAGGFRIGLNEAPENVYKAQLYVFTLEGWEFFPIPRIPDHKELPQKLHNSRWEEWFPSELWNHLCDYSQKSSCEAEFLMLIFKPRKINL